MHPDLEKLIDLFLADGVITDKERSVILRKAAAMGIDADEVELILEGKLAQLRKQSSAPTVQKLGTVKKCPSCGAALGALAANCDECGHELSNIEASRVIQKLVAKFEEIERATEGVGDITDKKRSQAIQIKRAAVIRDFAVPNEREELQQLILFIKPKLIEGVNADPNIHDWRIKFTEVLSRARNAYKTDSKMLAELDRIEASVKRTFVSRIYYAARRNPGKIAASLILVGLLVVGFVVVQEKKAKLALCEAKYAQAAVVEKSRLEKLLTKANGEYKEKNFDLALSSATQMKWEYSDECKQEDTAKAKAAWDEKRRDFVALVEKSIEADAAAKKAEAEMLAQEKQEAIALQAAKDQAEADAKGAQSQPQRAQAQAQPSDPGLQIFGSILNAITGVNKK
jgi:hypothetical protein